MVYRSKRLRRDSGKPRTLRGKPIVDATNRFAFVVTTQDCKKGKPNSPAACAAACALERVHPGALVAVFVHRTCVLVELKDKVIRYRTGSALRDQQIRYDAAKKFDTGRYVIGPPCPSTIRARGHQHSAPDRMRGNPANARMKAVVLRHHVGRPGFHFTAENSDFKQRNTK